MARWGHSLHIDGFSREHGLGQCLAAGYPIRRDAVLRPRRAGQQGCLHFRRGLLTPKPTHRWARSWLPAWCPRYRQLRRPQQVRHRRARGGQGLIRAGYVLHHPVRRQSPDASIFRLYDRRRDHMRAIDAIRRSTDDNTRRYLRAADSQRHQPGETPTVTANA